MFEIASEGFCGSFNGGLLMGLITPEGYFGGYSGVISGGLVRRVLGIHLNYFGGLLSRVPKTLNLL